VISNISKEGFTKELNIAADTPFVASK